MLPRVTTRDGGQDDTPTLEWPTTPAPARPTVARAADPLVVVAEAALDALMQCEQARRLAEGRVLLAEQATRDGAHLSSAELDRRGADACYQKRCEEFAVELVARVVPDFETLRLAEELDSHALVLWREVATSLVDEFPPSFAHLRGEVQQQRRAEQRTAAGLLRAEAELAARRRSRGWLARLDATLAAITQREADRAGWFADTGDILARGVAALHVLDTRSNHHASSHKGGPTRPVPGGLWPQVGS